MQILHGDNQVASRQKLLDLKKDKSVIEFLGSDLVLETLSNVVATKSLFGQANTIIIEGLFSLRNSALKKDLVSYLLNHLASEVIIWEGKDVSAQVKDFSQVQKFDLPKHIFAFLDSPSLSTFHLALSTVEPEVLFASLVTRAYKRANTKWLHELLAIDYKLKTGILPYDLTTGLELWCAKL